VKEYKEDDDPINLKIPVTKEDHVVEGLMIELDVYENSTRTHKVNIGTEENPKFANNGDYWNEEIVEMIVDLLRKYHDLFPTTFSEMKGITREIREMKISLNPSVNLVK
jgi:hypothetical protein